MGSIIGTLFPINKPFSSGGKSADPERKKSVDTGMCFCEEASLIRNDSSS